MSSFVVVMVQLFGLSNILPIHVNGEVSIGKQFRDNVDLKQLPCDDFYKFSCGNYIKNSVIDTEDLQINAATIAEREILKNLKESLDTSNKYNVPKFMKSLLAYYTTCKDEERINKEGTQEFRNFADSIGGWHLLGGKGKQKNCHWKQTVYSLRDYGLLYTHPFHVAYQPDVRESDKWIINLLGYQPLMVSPLELSRGFPDPRVQAYHKLLVSVAAELGADNEQAVQEFREMIEFEKNIAQLLLETVKKPEPEGFYVTINELQKLCPVVPWVEYLQKMLSPQSLRERLEGSTVIAMTARDFTRKLCKLISQTKPQTMANYLFSKVVITLSEHINSRLAHFRHEFLHGHKVNLVQFMPPRWERCILMAKAKMPLAIGAIFVRNIFDRSRKAMAQEIVNYIVRSFRQSLLGATWMSDFTKNKAIEKLDSMVSLVAYPDEILEDDRLNYVYKDLNIDSESFLINELRLSSFGIKTAYETIKNKLDWTHAYGDITHVNAHYKLRENAFVISAGILHGYYFQASNPKYILFAGIGSVIGHEIMHGFDDNGRHLDRNGVDYNWWDHNSEQNFLMKADTYWRHYQHLASFAGLEARDIGSMNENIADIEGLKHAYLAYELWCKDHGNENALPELSFTNSQQLFWMTYANSYCLWMWPMHRPQSDGDVHAKNHLRVIGPLSIIPQFKRDYKCKSVSSTNFDHKYMIL